MVRIQPDGQARMPVPWTQQLSWLPPPGSLLAGPGHVRMPGLVTRGVGRRGAPGPARLPGFDGPRHGARAKEASPQASPGTIELSQAGERIQFGGPD